MCGMRKEQSLHPRRLEQWPLPIQTRALSFYRDLPYFPERSWEAAWIPCMISSTGSDMRICLFFAANMITWKTEINKYGTIIVFILDNIFLVTPCLFLNKRPETMKNKGIWNRYIILNMHWGHPEWPITIRIIPMALAIATLLWCIVLLILLKQTLHY